MPNRLYDHERRNRPLTKSQTRTIGVSDSFSYIAALSYWTCFTGIGTPTASTSTTFDTSIRPGPTTVTSPVTFYSTTVTGPLSETSFTLTGTVPEDPTSTFTSTPTTTTVDDDEDDETLTTTWLPTTIIEVETSTSIWNTITSTLIIDTSTSWTSTITTTTKPPSTSIKPSTSTKTSTVTTSTPPPQPPSPLMPGVVSWCKKWYKVKSGDSCWTVEQAYGITFSQLRSWNTQLDAQCYNLWLGYYICVGV
ncbi:hypothetical protein QBC38DRAFT_492576 [Podospora fimiseda]|uniref:LysM domain-containing protein n=1 Tax=Podospora fimiseda TaxID=252190 RepID=A0AAN7BEP1_9PEZI|nr:hypothetical protein QBC38DRAFT_492576 [Podospora fimiseda]